MSAFKEVCFTPADFSRILNISKNDLKTLEDEGLIKTFRKRVGNVDRKMIALEEAQRFFRALREGLPVATATSPKELESAALDKAEVLSEIAKNIEDGTIEFSEGNDSDNFVNDVMSEENTSVEASDSNDGRHGDRSIEANRSEENSEETKESSIDIEKLFPKHLLGQTPKHKIQMFYNVKGGTGKSTLAAQFAMRAALMGFKVLAVDLDGQGHLTINLDVLDGHDRSTVYDILINDFPIKDSIVSVAPGLDLIPANLGLCNIEIPLNQKPRREYRLSEALEQIADQYDIIVADTNPAASILNCSMLVASDAVNVVCATNPLSFHGMSLVMSTLQEMQREFRKDLHINIIPNMYDNREVISQEVLGELRSQLPEFCTDSIVNRSADLNEATKRRTTVFDVSSRGVAAQDVNVMTEELVFGLKKEATIETTSEEEISPEQSAEEAQPEIQPEAEISEAEIPETEMNVSEASSSSEETQKSDEIETREEEVVAAPIEPVETNESRSHETPNLDA